RNDGIECREIGRDGGMFELDGGLQELEQVGAALRSGDRLDDAGLDLQHGLLSLLRCYGVGRARRARARLWAKVVLPPAGSAGLPAGSAASAAGAAAAARNVSAGRSPAAGGGACSAASKLGSRPRSR